MKIKDKSLGKYEIHQDSGNYSIIETTEYKDKDGKEIIKNVSYCSSMESALKNIVKLRVQEGLDVCDLKTYIERLKEVNQEVMMAFEKETV